MWAGGPLLVVLVVLMLMLMRLVDGARRIHHPVLWWSTTRWGCHSRPLLGFLVSTNGVVHYDGIAEELKKGATSVE
jgi:hypothetical protein